MNSYIRESHDLGDGKRLVTRYTPEEYIVTSILKFFLFLFVVWPLQLTFWVIVFIGKWVFKALYWAIVFICKWTFKGLIWLITLPFRILFHKKDE